MEKGLLANGGWYWSLILALGPKPPLEKQQPEGVTPFWCEPILGHAGTPFWKSGCMLLHAEGPPGGGCTGEGRVFGNRIMWFVQFRAGDGPMPQGPDLGAPGELLLWLGVEQWVDDGPGHAQQSAGEHFP